MYSFNGFETRGSEGCSGYRKPEEREIGRCKIGIRLGD